MKDYDTRPNSICDQRSIPLVTDILSREDNSNLGRLNRIWAEAEAKRLNIKIHPNPQQTLPASRFTKDKTTISARMAAVASNNS